jgi:hypothetical protein
MRILRISRSLGCGIIEGLFTAKSVGGLLEIQSMILCAHKALHRSKDLEESFGFEEKFGLAEDQLYIRARRISV